MSTSRENAEAPDVAEQRLPKLRTGDVLEVTQVDLKERKTRAPKPYTEGDLIDDMKGAGKYISDVELRKVLRETSGLGTSATRDGAIEALKHHKYLVTSGKTIIPTAKGTKFILWLDVVCPELTDIALTAKWEAQLAVVATKGGGSAFEADVSARIRELVNAFKICKPLDHTATEKTMNDQTTSPNPTPRVAGKPTPKQVDFARKIAAKMGIDLDETKPEVLADYDACRAFLDANVAFANKPSDKQLSFAANIAKSKGLTVPPEALLEGRELSKWIDTNK